MNKDFLFILYFYIAKKNYFSDLSKKIVSFFILKVFLF